MACFAFLTYFSVRGIGLGIAADHTMMSMTFSLIFGLWSYVSWRQLKLSTAALAYGEFHIHLACVQQDYMDFAGRVQFRPPLALSERARTWKADLTVQVLEDP